MHWYPMRPEPPQIKPRPRPFGFVGWLIIGLVTVAAVSVTLAINCGRV